MTRIPGVSCILLPLAFAFCTASKQLAVSLISAGQLEAVDYGW